MAGNAQYFVASTNILAIQTNTPRFKWSFGTVMPAATEREYARCPVRLRLTVTDDDADYTPNARVSEANGKYHYFSGPPNGDLLRYRRQFLFGSELRMEVRGLLSNDPHLLVNSNYFRFVTHRFMNLHSAGYVLTDLAALLLLRQGFSPIHCSAFRIGNATVVVLAPPNTGKTLSTMMACMEHGAEFIAEDLAITDGRAVHAVPWTSTFRYYSHVDERVGARALNTLTRWFPPLELLTVTRPQPIDTYVEKRRILERAEITHVVVLERGNEGIAEESREEIYRRAVNLNRYEFNYYKAPTSVAYEYFNRELDLHGAYMREREVLRSMIYGAQCAWVVRTSEAPRYASMLVNRLQNG